MKKIFKFLLFTIPLALFMCSCESNDDSNVPSSSIVEDISSSIISSSTATEETTSFEISTTTSTIEKNTLNVYYNDDLNQIYTVEYDESTIINDNLDFLVKSEYSKKHYSVDDWYIDVDCTQKATFPFNMNEDKNLYLGWNENSKGRVVIYYDGLANFTTKKIYLNDEYNFDELCADLLDDSMKKAGYIPYAFYYDADFKQPVQYPYSITKGTGNSLYLDWKSAAINGIINVNSDNEKQINHVFTLNDSLDENLINSICDLEKQYYSLDGWYYDKNYTEPVEFPLTLTEDFEIFAKWHYDYRKLCIYTYADENSYKEIMLEIGSSITEDTISNLINISSLTKNGYTVGDGWYKDDLYNEKIKFPFEITEDSPNIINLHYKWNFNGNALNYNLSATVFNNKSITDFTKYNGTDAYVQVTTVDQLIEAIANAKYEYTNNTISTYPTGTYKIRANVRKNATNWTNALNKGLYLLDEEGNYNKIPVDTPYIENDPLYTPEMTYYEDDVMGVDYNQTITKTGTVHVIEIMNDLNLGWNKISAATKSTYSGIVSDYNAKTKGNETSFTMSSMFKENGISNIQIANCYDLLIYSKNGAKLTHGGFSLLSSNNIAFRNLEMDEMWQWEDTASTSTTKVGDMDAFGWAYIKVSYCGYVWVDHCTFGKSYDGQIDVSNAFWANSSDLFRAPLSNDVNNPDTESKVTISWCNFKAGTYDGYLKKMMEEVEADYQAGNNNYLYYKALRDSGVSIDEIINGIAIPQKKGFLLGDNSDADEYRRNIHLSIEFKCCKFTNIEDRLPKLRGGNAVFSNCIIDCSQYAQYHTLLTGYNAANIVASVNNTWKCALVSQAGVCGNGGSLLYNNCTIKGVINIVKNNDSAPTGCNVNGGYRFIDSTYVNPTTGETITGSTPNTIFFNDTNILSVDNFKWNNDNNISPFNYISLSLDYLSNATYEIGVHTSYSLSWLACSYN